MITEPYIINIGGSLYIHQYAHWTALKLTLTRQDLVSHSFRSLVYVNRKARVEQVSILSHDIVAGVLKIDTWNIMCVLVYVPWDASATRENNAVTLIERLRLISVPWEEAQKKWGRGVELFVGGDFNRHDQMWGGDAVCKSPR